jgi:hypothetical protein
MIVLRNEINEVDGIVAYMKIKEMYTKFSANHSDGRHHLR